jgi:hypothetical protein
VKEAPVQEAQSGWQGRHAALLFAGKVPCGQVATHLPIAASWLLGHVRQNVGELAQVLHEESHALKKKKKKKKVSWMGGGLEGGVETYGCRLGYLLD